jgi:hypothetical protein
MTEGMPPQVSVEAAAMKTNPGAEIATRAEAIGKSRTSTVFALHLRRRPRRQRRSGLAPDRPEGNRRADRTAAAAEGSAAVDDPAQRPGQPRRWPRTALGAFAGQMENARKDKRPFLRATAPL